MKLSGQVLLAVVILASALIGAETASDKAVATYRQFMEAKEYAKAEAILRQLLIHTDVRSSQRGVYEADLLCVVRLSGRPQVALKMAGSLNQLQRIVPMVRLEVARCEIELGQFDAAEKELRLFNDPSDKQMEAYFQYELARIAFEKRQYDLCLKLCQEVLAAVRPMGDFLRYDADLRKLLADADALANAAKDARIGEKYGEDYARYVRGRRAQMRGDYQAAIKHYQPISTPILLDAGQCYTCQCLAKLGRKQEAVAAYRAFVGSDRLGLYRGEALYELGRLLLVDAQSAAEFQQGMDAIADAVAWTDTIEQKSKEIDMSKFEAALKEFPPPEQTMLSNRLGNYHRSWVMPETVVNRLTAKWYLPRLRMQILLLHAFGLNEQGRREQVTAAISQVLTLNKGEEERILNYDDMPDRLLVDARDGAFFLPTDIWSRLQSFEGRRLRLGYYFLVAGENQQARELFDRVSKATRSDIRERDTLAGAKLGLACLMFIDGKENEAIEELAAADNVFTRTTVDPLALIVKANLLAGRKEQYKQASELYESVAKRYAATDYAARALLGWTVMAANAGQMEDAKRMGQRLVTRYPNSDFSGAARTLLNQIGGGSVLATVGNPGPAIADAGGAVVVFERHLVIPGSVDIDVELGPRHLDDILSYRVDYSVRGGCGLKSFRLNLTPLEPQVPSVKGTKIAFYRVPAFLLAPGTGAGTGH